MSSLRASVIIVSFNTSNLTLRLIESLYRYEVGNQYELIVVDNASSDNSVSELKSKYPDIRLIANKKNLGFGKAVNQASRIAEGEYIWLLNSDCRLKEPIMVKLIDTLEHESSAFAVTPRTVNSSGRFHSSCRRFPTYDNIIFSRGSILARLPFFRHRQVEYTLPDFPGTTRVEAISGTAMLMRKDEFIASGGFDERFFMYLEDTDLCYRMYNKKRYCYYRPDAEVEHLNKASSRGRQGRRLYHHHMSTLEYFLKWYPNYYLHNFLLVLLLTLNLFVKIILINAGLLSDNDS
ncbi:MAG: glycosyltransferase [candidate division Zixibacteria bacterium]|nr:glycosyltransferase [candidate division Zixibacteria bacterium]